MAGPVVVLPLVVMQRPVAFPSHGFSPSTASTGLGAAEPAAGLGDFCATALLWWTALTLRLIKQCWQPAVNTSRCSRDQKDVVHLDISNAAGTLLV